MGEEIAKLAARRRLADRSNPLLVKELRGRMRGARAFVVLTVYLLLMSCLTAVVYLSYLLTEGDGGGASTMAYLGKVVFSSVALIEILMVTFITPAFTAGAISGERERMTYEVLRTTLLSARKLVLGKLAAALTYMLLLVLAAVPLQSLAFMLGGVTVEELGLALLIVVVSTFFFAVAGLFFSSVMRTTLGSTALTYGTALLSTIGLPLIGVLVATVVSVAVMDVGPTDSWVWEAVALYALIFVSSLSPISTAVVAEVFLVEENALFYYWQDVGYSHSLSVGAVHRIPVPSPWVIYVVIYLTLGLILLLATVLRVRRQVSR